MDKGKFSDKIKEGISVKEIEDFARKYTPQVFFIVALLIGGISSAFDFFTGPGLTLFFLSVGAAAAVAFPPSAERALKQLYGFLNHQDKTTEMIIGCVQIVIAIFVPFLFFGLVGILAGTSFHYYIRHAQIVSENRPSRPPKSMSGDEHD